jgi:hypothetical protein
MLGDVLLRYAPTTFHIVDVDDFFYNILSWPFHPGPSDPGRLITNR